jgi:hypothetical protein
MLVNFVVKNFGPFKDEAILTMTANKGNEHPENYKETATGNILTSAAIFGPNAAGKTYIIDALSYLRNIVVQPGLPNAPMPGYNPFRLSKDTKTAPVEMNIKFITENILYDYHVSFNGQRIIAEWLYYYPNKRRTEVFKRTADSFEFGRSSGVGHSISKITSPNTTGVFTAAQFNNDICKKVHKWFLSDLIILGNSDDGRLLEIFVERINVDKDLKEKAIKALRIADFAISDVQGTVRKRKVQDLPGIPTQAKNLMLFTGSEEVTETELYLFHDVDGEGLTAEDKRFPIQLESAGTVRFLAIIGPIIDTLTYGKTIVIDEFGQRLHCMLSRWIVEMFCDKRHNSAGGQLIFNTQSTHLLDQDIFRRDQIYLVDKNEKGESELFSLSDFGERKDRVVLISYLDGKYGATPFIDEGTVL